ncbi:MAG: hypothetical protein ABSF60_14040 [Verrucomicrobiota bacterium]
MKPPIIIEIEDEFLSALFTSAPTVGSLESVMKAVEDFLSMGAVVRIMQAGQPIKQFDSPGQFIDHVNKLLASRVVCPKCEYQFLCAPGWISASNTIGCPKCGEMIQLK